MRKPSKLLSAILAASMIASVSPAAFAAPRYKEDSTFAKAFGYGLLGAGMASVAIFTGVEIYKVLSAKDEDTSNRVITINSQQDFEKIKNHKNEVVKVIVNVEDIPHNAFENCPELEEAQLPGVKTIGMCSFAGCKKLKKVNAPKLTTICAGAFINCEMLEDLDLENVSKIGINAFGGCKKFSFMDLVNAGNN